VTVPSGATGLFLYVTEIKLTLSYEIWYCDYINKNAANWQPSIIRNPQINKGIWL